MDLNSSHGSSVGGKRVRPREPIGPLPLGTTISFGASSRQYRLIGLAEPASSTGMARPTGTAIGTGGAEMPADSGMDARLAQLRAVAGTLADEKADGDEDEVGGNKRSRDGSKGMHPKKLAKKKRKWMCVSQPILEPSPAHAGELGLESCTGIPGFWGAPTSLAPRRHAHLEITCPFRRQLSEHQPTPKNFQPLPLACALSELDPSRPRACRRMSASQGWRARARV
eukprot:scaffold7906_cov30-Tisochrysis_lutea.AAC.4